MNFHIAHSHATLIIMRAFIVNYAVIFHFLLHLISNCVLSNNGQKFISPQDIYEKGGDCDWKYSNRRNVPEVFWVNMDKSVDRRETMEKHLNRIGFVNYRVKGVSIDEIFIPPDIENSWNHHIKAKYNSDLLRNYNKTKPKHQYVISGLFGRKKKNRLKELGCTLSHLLAIRKAVYSPTAVSRYALIFEDDVQVPFDIDFDKLVGAVGFELKAIIANTLTMISPYRLSLCTCRCSYVMHFPLLSSLSASSRLHLPHQILESFRSSIHARPAWSSAGNCSPKKINFGSRGLQSNSW